MMPTPPTDTLNYVTVSGYFATKPVGSIVFAVTDLIWNTADGWVYAMPEVGQAIGTNGTFSVSLLAMDNAALSANWKWRVTVDITGITFPPRLLVVEYKQGAAQDFTTLLDASELA